MKKCEVKKAWMKVSCESVAAAAVAVAVVVGGGDDDDNSWSYHDCMSHDILRLRVQRG